MATLPRRESRKLKAASERCCSSCKEDRTRKNEEMKDKEKERRKKEKPEWHCSLQRRMLASSGPVHGGAACLWRVSSSVPDYRVCIVAVPSII